MSKFDYDLIVIGAGSGGTRTARISASYGAKTLVVEGDRAGGTCVLRGCVPKKLLVYASQFSEQVSDAEGFCWQVKDYERNWGELIKKKNKELGTVLRVKQRIDLVIGEAKNFQNEDTRMIQRLIESGIRHYLSMNPDDDDSLIPIAWVSCNSESKSKLSGMLIELAKINQQSFVKISSNIFDLSPDSHDELFNRINFRNKKLGSLIKNNQ